jgi:hypothetical protein
MTNMNLAYPVTGILARLADDIGGQHSSGKRCRNKGLDSTRHQGNTVSLFFQLYEGRTMAHPVFTVGQIAGSFGANGLPLVRRAKRGFGRMEA